MRKQMPTTYQSLQSENETSILRTEEDCAQICRDKHSSNIGRNFCFIGCRVTHPDKWFKYSYSQESTLSKDSEDYTNDDSTNPLSLI